MALSEPTSSEPTIERWHRTAAEAAARLRGRTGLAWIDSAARAGSRGRWSIVASDPRWRLVAYGDDVLFEGPAGPRRLGPGALSALTTLIEADPTVADHDLPFVGGAIGYLGFELGREIESLPATSLDDVGAPDLAFGWYNAAVVEDHERGNCWLVGRPDCVAALRRRLAAPAATPTASASSGRGLLRSNMPRDQYLASVSRARSYIEAGDIYQVNLSQRFSTLCSIEGLDLYASLRRVSPAPFSAYLDLRSDLSSLEVLSSSPGAAPAR